MHARTHAPARIRPPKLKTLNPKPQCEYSEYPTAGASAPPPPTGDAVNDTSTPPHGDAAAHTAGASCAEYPMGVLKHTQREYSEYPM